MLPLRVASFYITKNTMTIRTIRFSFACNNKIMWRCRKYLPSQV